MSGQILLSFHTRCQFPPGSWCDRTAVYQIEGQSLPVSILIPYHASTAQEVALDLVARKVTGSLQVDGLDMQAALEAAGASGEANAAVAAAMSIGEAVFKRLVQRETRAIAL